MVIPPPPKKKKKKLHLIRGGLRVPIASTKISLWRLDLVIYHYTAIRWGISCGWFFSALPTNHKNVEISTTKPPSSTRQNRATVLSGTWMRVALGLSRVPGRRSTPPWGWGMLDHQAKQHPFFQHPRHSRPNSNVPTGPQSSGKTCFFRIFWQGCMHWNL